MTNNTDGAFPMAFVDQSDSKFDGQQIVDLGISVRDYFAARAMAAIICAVLQHPRANDTVEYDKVASDAYGFAEAMVALRQKIDDELILGGK